MVCRLGVFGGTFDPIHHGHLITASDVREHLHLDSILFVPNAQPPHKTDRAVAPVKDRVAMVELALAGNDNFQIDLAEARRPGLSYALDTMRLIREREGGPDLFFIAGLDAFLDLHTWHQPDTLLREFQFAVMDRNLSGGQHPSFLPLLDRFPNVAERAQIVPVTRVDISATDIRRRVTESRSIRYLVPDGVEAYIAEKGLYRDQM